MTNLTYKSRLKTDIIDFIELKHNSGYKYNTEEYYLRSLDIFLVENYPNETELNKDIVTKFTTEVNNIGPGSIRRRNIAIREFSKYLLSINKNVYVLPSSSLPKVRKYQSYIFNEAEINEILKVLDNCEYKTIYPNLYKVYSVFFRILYCCGLRLSEALTLKVKDIDLNNGILYVYESKNANTRLVPMTEELTAKCKEYYKQAKNKYTSNESYFFFAKDSNIKIRNDHVRNTFLRILKLSNIAYQGKGKGPRIHDFRHTFCVHCFKKFVLAGEDLNVYMPILKTYMGHTNFSATEYYLKLTADMYPNIRKKIEETFGDIIPTIEGDYIEK